MKSLSRARYWQIKAVSFGKCRRCGRPRGNSTSKVRCALCISLDQQSDKRRALARKQAGLCLRCDRALGNLSVVFCDLHAKIAKDYNAVYKFRQNRDIRVH